MIAELPPGLILIVGGLLVPLVPGRWRGAYMLVLPLLGLLQLTQIEIGSFGLISFSGYELIHVRVDKLAILFALIFYIATLINLIYALHVKDAPQQVSGLLYPGAAIGAVFAGDLITLFVYWEITAVSSAFLIWAARTPRSHDAGIRYLIIQILSGVLLAAGAALQVAKTGSLAFNHIGLDGPGGVLIFLAFGIKCAFPLMHNWLQDSYPESTVTGTVMLSAFTTKLAIYALARGYAGTEMLIWIGATMTALPIFYAVIENDLRRVLSYSLNNQLGFMVVGIGIGTELALNGTVGHAFAHILYKALLFMAMGAVLFRTGTAKGSELGGLYKSMPWTTGFCIVGAASISAFPLFSGFVTKSMILTAAAYEGHWITWLVLLFASAGVFHHSGIKIPFFAFFAHDSGKRCAEAPLNMRIAMGITAFLSIAIGVYPDPLYALLPYPVDFVPYTTTHVMTTLQLLLFSGLAFATLQRTGLYPLELRSTNLDSDWLYRRLGPAVVRGLVAFFAPLDQALRRQCLASASALARTLAHRHGPLGILTRAQDVGQSALVVIAVLGLFLLVFFLS